MMYSNKFTPISASLKARLLCASLLATTSFVATASAQVSSGHIAADMSVAIHPGIGVSEQGIDQININAANAAGLSHNRFVEYNVGEKGLVLNNSTVDTQTQIGGKVLANTSLGNSPAKIILNEVNGGKPSNLAGLTEVAGQKAEVIVANPSGISCSGCGFVNTSRAILTTGKANIDDKGLLKNFEVTDGNVSFNSDADLTHVPVLDVVSRTVTIKERAKVKADSVHVVAGRNIVDHDNIENVQQIRSETQEKGPEFAVDTAAMGGLYANKIYLVVNENGAGVRVNGDMIANSGDLAISSSGDLVNRGEVAARQGQASFNVAGNIVNEAGVMTSNADANFNVAGDVRNKGRIEAVNGRINANVAGKIRNLSGTIAGRDGVTVQSAGGIENSATMSSKSGKLAISGAGDLINNEGGTIETKSGAMSFQLAGNLVNDGTINTGGSFTVQNASSINNLRNGKILVAGGNVSATTIGSLENAGTIKSDRAVSLRSTVNNLKNSGTVSGDTGVTLRSSNTLSNSGGSVNSSTGDVVLKTEMWSDLINTGGRISAGRNIDLGTKDVSNAGGHVFAGAGITGRAQGYSADDSSVFQAAKDFGIIFTGKVQNAGKFGSSAVSNPAPEQASAPGKPVQITPPVMDPVQTQFPLMIPGSAGWMTAAADTSPQVTPPVVEPVHFEFPFMVPGNSSWMSVAADRPAYVTPQVAKPVRPGAAPTVPNNRSWSYSVFFNGAQL